MPPVKKTHPPLRPTFLQKWRRHRGLTQEQAAELLGFSAPIISRIESGKSPYTQRFIEIAADVYGCTPGDLLDTDPTIKSPLNSIIELLKASPPEKIENLMKMMKIYLDDE